MTDRKNRPVILAEFNADAVTHYFGLKPHQEDERSVMRFVYDMLYAEENPHGDRLSRSRKAVTAAIESIEFPHSVLSVYGDDFMRDEIEFNHRALIYAVIGGEHLDKANEPLDQTPEEIEADARPKFPGEYLDEGTLKDAIVILEEADFLSAGGWFNPDKNPYAESFLVAHVFALKRLKDFEENFDAHDRAEIQTFVEDCIKPYEAFALPQTKLGELLQGYVQIVREKIDALEPPEPEKPKHPHLRLVTPEFRGFE